MYPCFLSLIFWVANIICYLLVKHTTYTGSYSLSIHKSASKAIDLYNLNNTSSVWCFLLSIWKEGCSKSYIFQHLYWTDLYWTDLYSSQDQIHSLSYARFWYKIRLQILYYWTSLTPPPCCCFFCLYFGHAVLLFVILGMQFCCLLFWAWSIVVCYFGHAVLLFVILCLQGFYDLMGLMKTAKLSRRSTMSRRSTIKIEKISVSDKDDGQNRGCCVLL